MAPNVAGVCVEGTLEVTIVKDGVRHIADIRVPETGLVIEVQHSKMPIEEARAREAFYENMIWIVDATEQKQFGREAVRLVGQNWGLIVVPRKFWSLLSQPTYIDTRWGLYEPAFWDGTRCQWTSGGEEALRIEVRVGADVGCGGNELGVLEGKAGRGGSGDGSEHGFPTRACCMGTSYPYSNELREAGFIWCPRFWRYLTKAEKSAREKEKCERDAELARQAKAKLDLDPVYKEEQRVREMEQEALAQRRREEEAAEAQRRRDEEAAEAQRRRDVEAAEAQRRREELQARRDRTDMLHEGRKRAESRERQLMSDAVKALQRLMANEQCSEASRDTYVKQLAAQAGRLEKIQAESVVFMADGLHK